MTPQQLAEKEYPTKQGLNDKGILKTLTECERAAFIKGYEANQTEFLKFINQTELSEKDKNLVKGVYYDFMS